MKVLGESSLKEILKTLDELRLQLNILTGLMNEMNKNLNKLVASTRRLRREEYGGLDVMSLIDLPDHLRKTLLALMKLGEATAKDVSRRTGRSRSIESSYLNQLVRLGYVTKVKRSRKTFFKVGE